MTFYDKKNKERIYIKKIEKLVNACIVSHSAWVRRRFFSPVMPDTSTADRRVLFRGGAAIMFLLSCQPPDRGAGLTDFLILQGFTLQPHTPIRCCRQTAAVRRLLRGNVTVTEFQENFLLTKPWGSAGKFITTEKLSTAGKAEQRRTEGFGFTQTTPPLRAPLPPWVQ